MFSSIFNSVRDLNYVKVTKENWNRIEALFDKKESTISAQNIKIDAMTNKIDKMKEELELLKKFKENDDLVYAYETECESLRKNNKILLDENKRLAKSIEKAEMKVDAVLSLESAYLQKIIQAESSTRRALNGCPNYEEKGNALLEIYA